MTAQYLGILKTLTMLNKTLTFRDGDGDANADADADADAGVTAIARTIRSNSRAKNGRIGSFSVTKTDILIW